MKQLFRYAMGRREGISDRPALRKIYDDFRDSGFHFQELMVSSRNGPSFLPGGKLMPAVLIKKRALSRRFFLRGSRRLPARRCASACRLWPRCSTRRGLPTPRHRQRSEASHSRRDLSSGSTETEFPRSTGFRCETGPDFTMTPCLSPLAPFRKDIHVITGFDNPAARLPGPGNDHHRSMSALVSGTQFTGHGAGGPSIDQAIAAKWAGIQASVRCRSGFRKSRLARAFSAT